VIYMIYMICLVSFSESRDLRKIDRGFRIGCHMGTHSRDEIKHSNMKGCPIQYHF